MRPKRAGTGWGLVYHNVAGSHRKPQETIGGRAGPQCRGRAGGRQQDSSQPTPATRGQHPSAKVKGEGSVGTPAGPSRARQQPKATDRPPAACVLHCQSQYVHQESHAATLPAHTPTQPQGVSTSPPMECESNQTIKGICMVRSPPRTCTAPQRCLSQPARTCVCQRSLR